MKAEALLQQAVRIIDPHSRAYQQTVIVKAIQYGLDGKPATVLVTSKETGELEVTLADISTSLKRKLTRQTEFFL